jgi:NADPH:quinone reductase-like Zn-dependent oxidoreductase
MRAAVHTKYGPPEVLRVADVPKPRTRDDEIRIQVHCTTVNRTDAGFLRGKPFVTRFFSGVVRPRHPTLGCEFAGEVEAVGAAVTRFAVGDRVFGFDDARWGGQAEYKVIAGDKAVAKIPAGISYEQAAASTEGAHYALVYIRATKIARGDRVLVHGATGAIGSAAVQLMKHVGAHVIATSDTRNLALVASLGADQVIDRQQQDFTRCGQRFRVVFDSVGKSSFGACKPLLEERGIYISTELGPMGQNPLYGLASPVFARFGARRIMFPIPTCNRQDIEYLAQRLEDGGFKPVIDRTYSLDDVVEAFHYVETGQKTGNVVIRVRG